ncbi:RNA polymerase sigma-70 factor [Mucilaginibacter sp. UC70_90]
MTRYQDLSDDQLIVLLKQSDEQALAALYHRYWEKMLSVAVTRLESIGEAEEIVQDIFINLWDRRTGLELRHSIASYLAIAIKYRVINRMDYHYRKRNREAASGLTVSYTASSPEEIMLEKELMQRIELAVLQLPEKCRIVYRMSREEGKTNKQIAETLAVSEKTVEGHITNALKGIRGNLGAGLPFFAAFLAEQYLK